MKKFDSLNDVVNAIIDAIEVQGASVHITGGSAQSCSTYLDVNGLAVRISDHAPRTQLSQVDYHIGLGSSHGSDVIEVRPVYEQMVGVEFDEDGDAIEFDYVECGADDEDAEHVGYAATTSEIERAARSVILASKE